MLLRWTQILFPTQHTDPNLPLIYLYLEDCSEGSKACSWLNIAHAHTYSVCPQCTWQVMLYSSLKLIPTVNCKVSSCRLEDLENSPSCFCLPACQKKRSTEAGPNVKLWIVCPEKHGNVMMVHVVQRRAAVPTMSNTVILECTQRRVFSMKWCWSTRKPLLLHDIKGPPSRKRLGVGVVVGGLSSSFHLME